MSNSNQSQQNIQSKIGFLRAHLSSNRLKLQWVLFCVRLLRFEWNNLNHLDIVESILMSGRETVSENLIPLINLLSLRCSTYLHSLVLRLLQVIIPWIRG